MFLRSPKAFLMLHVFLLSDFAPLQWICVIFRVIIMSWISRHLSLWPPESLCLVSRSEQIDVQIWFIVWRWCFTAHSCIHTLSHSAKRTQPCCRGRWWQRLHRDRRACVVMAAIKPSCKRLLEAPVSVSHKAALRFFCFPTNSHE